MKSIYSPKSFGSLIGRTTSTLQRWDRAGILKAHRSITGRRYYTHEQYLQIIGQCLRERKIVSYCRVSSNGQKRDLATQRDAVEAFCLTSGRIVQEKLEDIGSGLNYNRKNFIKLMEMVEQGTLSEIVIAHKDRLVRFGFEWFEKFCKDHGTNIIVMNATSLSPEAEMTKDLLSIIHCFSSRLYGLRKYKNKIVKIVSGHENGQA